MIRKSLFSIVIVVLFLARLAAHELPAFQQRLDISLFNELKKDARAETFFGRNIFYKIYTEKELSLEELKSGSFPGLMKGVYRDPAGAVDLNLSIQLRQGTIETSQTWYDFKSAHDKILQEISKNSPLRAFEPTLRKIIYHDGMSFDVEMGLKKKFDYIVRFEVPVDLGKSSIGEPDPTFKNIAKFIRFMEKDRRAKTILANNLSGRAAEIIKQGEDELIAFHPFHRIRWDYKSKVHYYEYRDKIYEVRNLPEVKRILKNSDVKEALQGNTEEARIEIKGRRKYFEGLIVSPQLDKPLQVKVEKRKVTIVE